MAKIGAKIHEGKREYPAALRPMQPLAVGTVITPGMIRRQAVKNARGLGEMVEAGRLATDSGKGGSKGKRYRGYFFHQLVSAFVGCVAETYATDAALQPKADLMTRVLGGAAQAVAV